MVNMTEWYSKRYIETLYFEKRPSKYESFKENILLDFEDMTEDIKTKDELQLLMQQHRYRTKYTLHKPYKAMPTEAQVNIAWAWLKGKSIPTLDSWIDVVLPKVGLHRRALKNMRIGNKDYKAGQFIPRQKRHGGK